MNMINVRTLFICLLCISLMTLISPQPAFAQQAEWKLLKTYRISMYGSPYGKITAFIDIFKLINDDSTTWDWFMVKTRLQTVPGYLAYASDWRTDYTWNYHYIRYYYSYQYLAGYAPTTTPGTQTSGWSFNIGVGVGVAGSYPVPLPSISGGWINTWTSGDAMIKDQGDFVSHTAAWWWDINEGANVGMQTYQSESGYIVMLNEGYSLGIRLNFGVRWIDPEPWPYPPGLETWSIWWSIWYP